jgi:hypothetical protein
MMHTKSSSRMIMRAALLGGLTACFTPAIAASPSDPSGNYCIATTQNGADGSLSRACLASAHNAM